MPKLCWCGRDHRTFAEHGDIRNGPLKHWVINWKLYELRMVDLGLDPFGEEKGNGHKPKDIPTESLDDCQVMGLAEL